MEYRLQRPELVRTEFHSRSLEGIAGQLEQEELRQEKRDRYIDQICLVAHKLLHQNRGLLKVQWNAAQSQKHQQREMANSTHARR